MAPAGRLPLRPRYSTTTTTTLPHSSLPAQTALLTSLLGLAIKLTGTRSYGFPDQLPGANVQGEAKVEVSCYLTIIQDIADAMAEANNSYKTAESANLGRMHADLNKILGDF